MLQEFTRIVEESEPAWCLLENVTNCPDISPRGYIMQRFWMNATDVGCRQNRHRRFQFGSLDGHGLVIPAVTPPAGRIEPTCMATEGERKERRTWADFCELQGLPRTFDLPGWSIKAKYRAVGNGVPIPLGRVIAAAISDRGVTAGTRVCVCGCGRVPPAGAVHVNATCRKRMQRMRDAVTQA